MTFALENSQEVKTQRDEDGSEGEPLNQELQDSSKSHVRNNSADKFIKEMCKWPSNASTEGSIGEH